MDNVEDFERARVANARRPAGVPATAHAIREALWLDTEAWDEADIPKRPWVVRGYLLRGAVTIAAGPGGAGKSSLVCAWSCAMALGMSYGRFDPEKPLKIIGYSVEDDALEQRRRMSAALRQFGKTPRDLGKRLIRCGPTTVGTLIERDPVTGQLALTDAWEGLEALLAEHRPDVLTLDPFAEIHTAEETDNTALRQVIARVRELAQTYDCAILLIHHTRKGSVAGDPDSIRGASAIVGAVRVALTVASMTEEEAEQLGQSIDTRRQFFRVDLVKQNYAPPARADWHVMHEYDLDNGEQVAAAVPWDAPSPITHKIDPDTLQSLLAGIAAGTDSGPYSPQMSTERPRSVSALMLRYGIQQPKAMKEALGALLAPGGGVRIAEWVDQHRRPRVGLRTVTGLPRVRWTTLGEPSLLDGVPE